MQHEWSGMNKERVFLMKAAIVFLVVCVLAEFLLLWSVTRRVEPLPQMARLTTSEPAAAVDKPLSLLQCIAGLARLDGSPALLLDAKQAERLVPVVPLFRQALVEGITATSSSTATTKTAGSVATDATNNAGSSTATTKNAGSATTDATKTNTLKNNATKSGDSAPTVGDFGTMLTDYIVATLRPEQLNHLQLLASSGQLSNTTAQVVAQLPLLDKKLRQRAGMASERSDTVQSPVRRSLDKVRLRDLALGMLLLEQYPEYRLTIEQAARLVPMQKMLLEVFSREPGTVGKTSVPVVEAQVRSVLTDAQLSKLLELSQSNFVNYIDVNEEELGRQFCTMLAARENGGVFLFSLYAFMAPVEASREGPAVIPGKAELELVTAVRGIILHLEPNDKLRLDKTQVSELALIAPAVQQCLLNLLNGVRDLRLPELQGRVVRLLRPEQIDYILLHKNDPMVAFDYSPGEEPIAKELGRFLDARAADAPYKPQVKLKSLASGQMATGGQPETPPQQYVAPTAPAGDPGAGKEKPQITKPNPVRLPLEAIVRGILFSLERNPDLALKTAQVQQLSVKMKECQAVLDRQEREQDTMERSDSVVELTKQVYGILSQKQRNYISSTERASRVGLQPATGQSALSRELERFIKARTAGTSYTPLLSGAQ